MDKDQCEKNIKKPSEGETNTINGPKETERSEREGTRQPHELTSADLPVPGSQNLSNDLNVEDMDTSELVNYLMSPLNIPREATELEEDQETFNFETILIDEIYEDDDREFINILDEDFSQVFDEDESFDEE